MNKKPETIKNNLIFDIDSSTVGVGLFEFGYDIRGQCIHVRELATIRESITDGRLYPFEEFWQRAQSTLRKVAEKIHLQSLIPLGNIYCNVSSPWASAQKRTIKYSKNKPFILTQKLADQLIEKELASSLKNNLDYHNHDVDFIDRKTIAARSNGYSVRNPISKEMSDLEIDSLVTVVSTKTKKVFEHVIEKVFHRTPLFTSNIFIAYNNVQKTLPHQNDAIVVDVSGEMTEVIIIKNDHLSLIGTLPVGINHLLRDTSSYVGDSLAKTQKNIQLLFNSNLEKEYELKIKKALNHSYKKWLKEFYGFCDEASKQGSLPNTIVMKTYDKSMHWFESMLLQSDELSEHLHARARIEVIHLPPGYQDEKISLEISDSELRVVARTIALDIL